ncbi:MFS transporter [Streptomyces sp. NPDC001315]|uniref:MFS transporter n=1 Tax=Streptomyces sp. NPDC001315 TaxID=3364562 RepID=UPI0036A029F4
MAHWRALAVLGTAQFLMVLDTSVMNVSISRLVEDFDTEVTAIQAVITLYALVMAAFMTVGGKLGDILGRRRLFFLGLVVYGVGSALTAVAPSLWVLALGWSIIEGLGAAMVLPAMAALVAETYRAPDRAVAYGVIGGLAGAGIAVGPLLGGWVTTYLTWRLVFAGEVVVVLIVLCCNRVIAKTARTGPRHALDGVGATLSASGLGLDPRISDQARQQTGIALEAGISFVSTQQVHTAAERAGLTPADAEAVTESYAAAQLDGLKVAILAAGGVTLVSFLATAHLPAGRQVRGAAHPQTGLAS